MINNWFIWSDDWSRPTMLQNFFLLLLRLQNTTMGRKMMYRCGLIRRYEYDEYKRIQVAIAKKRTTSHRAYVKFCTFCTINTLDPKLPASILKYMACNLQAGMDPGSLLTMLRYIESEDHNVEMPDQITNRAIRGYLRLQKTKKGSRHAKDADVHVLIASLEACPSCEYRTQLALILLVGLRNADLEGTGARRIRENDTPPKILFDVIVSKQRKRPEEKVLLRIQGPLCKAGLFSQGLLRDMKRWRPQLFRPVALVLPWMKTQPSLRMFSTYTFRRNYVHRVLEEFTEVDGTVDWEKVTQYTLHFSEKVVKSVYAKTAEELYSEDD